MEGSQSPSIFDAIFIYPLETKPSKGRRDKLTETDDCAIAGSLLLFFPINLSQDGENEHDEKKQLHAESNSLL